MSGTAIRASFRLTRSAASVGSRSCWLSAHRYSIATFWPSINAASFKPRMERGHGLPGVTGRFAFEESNDRHLRLLRARRERPRGRRAPEQREELAAP